MVPQARAALESVQLHQCTALQLTQEQVFSIYCKAINWKHHLHYYCGGYTLLLDVLLGKFNVRIFYRDHEGNLLIGRFQALVQEWLRLYSNEPRKSS